MSTAPARANTSATSRHSVYRPNLGYTSATSRPRLGYNLGYFPHRHAPILGSAANEPEAEGPRRVSIARMQNTLMACRHVLRHIREEVRHIAEMQRGVIMQPVLAVRHLANCVAGASAAAPRARTGG